MIAARSKDNIIGIDGELPWYIPEDFIWFKERTTGYPIIMGSKTFKEIGKPLQGRINIILTRDKIKLLKDNPNLEEYLTNDLTIDNLTYNELYIVESDLELFNLLKDLKLVECFIIGGSNLYNQFIDITDTFYLTEVNINLEQVSGEKVKFEYNFNETEWYLNYRQTIMANIGTVAFEIYKRI